jgi:Tfp pilus assembly protein PilO
MKAIFGGGGVPLSRVLREHRSALLPLAAVLAINSIVLVAVVLPLAQRAASNDTRAAAAQRAEAAAEAEFKQAEAFREGKTRATADLETFYREVLPTDATAARRITHLKPQQRAREHRVQYERGATEEETIDDSSLERQTVTMTLSGSWDDIRAFIYTLETSADFVVIDNVVIQESTGGNSALSLDLNLTTYYRSDRAIKARARTSGR